MPDNQKHERVGLDSDPGTLEVIDEWAQIASRGRVTGLRIEVDHPLDPLAVFADVDVGYLVDRAGARDRVGIGGAGVPIVDDRVGLLHLRRSRR